MMKWDIPDTTNDDLLERDISARVVKHARKLGFKAYKQEIVSWPDYLFLGHEGLDFYIEFKRKGKKPTPAQSDIHNMLRERGKLVFVIDNVVDGKALVKLHSCFTRRESNGSSGKS